MSQEYDDVERTLQNLKDSDVSPENAQAIRDLVNHAASEGVGDSQQIRIVYGLKLLLEKYAPEDFQLRNATEEELREMIAALHRSDYADATKHKAKAALKKFYKVDNGGEHPDKVGFFSTQASSKPTNVTRDDLFTDQELKRLLQNFSNTRDRALTWVMYESGGRPGEILAMSLGDFTSDAKGDFVFLEGLKNTPDRTNQLIRAGRTLREWIATHPAGGELGDLENPSAPMWVKTEQQSCTHCGNTPQKHPSGCNYEPTQIDPLKYDAFLRRFKKACRDAGIPKNKRRPYNLRHTRLTEVAKFMGYEQLNKFAGWVPGSSRAKVYVHLNNDDVNQAIREQYGLEVDEDENKHVSCPFCGTDNQSGHSECRTCGRPLSLKQKTAGEERQRILERLVQLEEQGVLQKLERLESLI